MPDIRYIVEFVMVFIIAYLISQHLQLKQEHNALKLLHSQSKKCKCHHADGINPMMQSSTIPSLLSTPSPSQHTLGMYWEDSDASSSSEQPDHEKQGQSIYSVISRSDPPIIDVIVNPSETGTSEIIVSDQNTGTSSFKEVKTDTVPETESASNNKIPHIQSSVTFSTPSTSTAQDSKLATNTRLPHFSGSVNFLPHSPTSLLPTSENANQKIQANRYDLPSEQTLTASYLDADQTELPLTTSIKESEREEMENMNIQKTSVSSDPIKKVVGEKGAFNVPLHAPTSSTVSSLGDNMVPSSTKAQDPSSIESELTDKPYDIRDNILSPHRPILLHRENTHEDNDDMVEESESLSIYKIVPSDKDKDSLIRGSSAKCRGSTLGQKHCVFNNICYNSQKKDFIFFKGPDSILESDGTLNVTDIFSLSLSTLIEHNTLLLSLVTLPVDALAGFSISMISKKSIAVSRFKPDNIMHVLHDDVLPLYHTLQHFGFPRKAGAFDAIIFFTDIYDDGDYIQFYSSLSVFKPISLKQFNASQWLTCFADLHIGLLTSTVWYQYGFFQPQGPIPEINSLAFSHIQEASQHIANHFHTDCFLCNQKNYLVLLSRKDNRLILNEGELIFKLSNMARLKVVSISLETHKLPEIVTIIRSSRGVIGMHGSLMAVSVFLPPGGIVIELFPFAVNPSRYTPFKTFADLPGSFLLYKSWVNEDASKSVSHPDGIPEEGGITHLPSQTQKEISSQTEIPEHLCCNDPSWLYHIYQDTYINISAVVSLTVQSLETQSSKYSPSQPLAPVPDIPGAVAEIHCERNSDKQPQEITKAFTVSWEPHWSLSYYPSPHKLRYVVVVQEEGVLDSHMESLAIDTLSFTFGDIMTDSHSMFFNVWTFLVDVESGVKSQSKYVRCH